MADLIAGFPQAQWDLFLAPIPLAFLYKSPVGNATYVKHQYCVEILNKAFGADGWTSECELVSDKDQYVDLYHAKDAGGKSAFDANGDPVFKKKLGRKYAVVKCRLTICAPGYPHPVFHEDFGSQVAAADWSEAVKGAASEALKRAASRFGFAAEVYQTEEIEKQFGEDWETAILPTYSAPYVLPLEHAAKIRNWMEELGWSTELQEEQMALARDSAEKTENLGRHLMWIVKTARPDAVSLMRSMGTPDEEQQATLDLMVDVKSAQEIVTKLKEEAAQWVGGGGDGEPVAAGGRLL